MDLRMPLARLVWSSLIAAVAVSVLSADAMAAKEKFQRSKPHVDVGTIGSASGANAADLIAPEGEGTASQGSDRSSGCTSDPVKATGQSPPPC